MNRRELIAATAAALAALGLKDLLGTAEALAQPKPKAGGKFVYTNLYPNNRMGDAKNGRHPYYLLDINTRSAFNGLAYVNDRLQVEPELALSWTPSADVKVWDIQLREGVVLHNGRDMTADDVVSSFAFHQATTSFARQIKKVEKTGTHKVRMHLDKPNSEFPYILGEYQLMIMPAAPIETIGLDGIVTGPYRLVGPDPTQAVPMLIAGAIAHAGFGDISIAVVVSLLIGQIPGVWVGARMSSRYDGHALRWLLMVVLAATALKLLGVSSLIAGMIAIVGVAIVSVLYVRERMHATS